MAPPAESPTTAAGPRRIALYSHDTLGLGHIRRNLAIATALAADLDAPDILLISGIRDAHAFPLPPHTDLLTLPAVHKDATGGYAPRALSGTLEELVELRGGIVAAALDQFAPDLLIVDKVAGGVCGELAPALARLSMRNRSRVVLGLRDILDDPESVRRDWARDRTDLLLAHYFDEIWVYGDAAIADPVEEYGLSGAVARKLWFAGYLAPPLPEMVTALPPEVPLDAPYVLGLVGGGQDGRALAEAFARAPLADGMAAVLVCGPHMPAEDRAVIDAIAAERAALTVLGFVPDCGPLAAHAEGVVAMGGYNTTVELLAAGTRTLLVPRDQPRREQRIRAERLAALGAVDLLPSERLSAREIGSWLAHGTRRRTRRDDVPVRIDGLSRLAQRARRLCAPSDLGAGGDRSVTPALATTGVLHAAR